MDNNKDQIGEVTSTLSGDKGTGTGGGGEEECHCNNEGGGGDDGKKGRCGVGSGCGAEGGKCEGGCGGRGGITGERSHFDSSCYWKRQYLLVREELSSFRHKTHEETQAELSTLEERLRAVIGDAEELKLSLESENRKLRHDTTRLEIINKSLHNELAETRNRRDNDWDHMNNLKKQLEQKLLELEDQLITKDANISSLKIQLEEGKKRIDFLSNEVRKQDKLIAELHQDRVEKKIEFDREIDRLSKKTETVMKTIQSKYSQALDSVGQNCDELEKELISKSKELEELISKDNLRNAQFHTSKASLKQFVDEALEMTQNALLKVRHAGVLTLNEREKMENEFKNVAEALKFLGNDLQSFKTDSNLIFEKIYELLGLELDDIHIQSAQSLDKNDDGPYHLPLTLDSKPSYEAFRNIGPGAGEIVSESACKVLQMLKENRNRLWKFLKTIELWQGKIKGQDGEFQRKISELEETIRENKTKYLKEIELANEKISKYKKVAKRLDKMKKELERENIEKTKQLENVMKTEDNPTNPYDPDPTMETLNDGVGVGGDATVTDNNDKSKHSSPPKSDKKSPPSEVKDKHTDTSKVEKAANTKRISPKSSEKKKKSRASKSKSKSKSPCPCPKYKYLLEKTEKILNEIESSSIPEQKSVEDSKIDC